MTRNEHNTIMIEIIKLHQKLMPSGVDGIFISIDNSEGKSNVSMNTTITDNECVNEFLELLIARRREIGEG